MSNYPNGQPYYSAHGYGAQSPNNQYGTTDQSQQDMRRTSSFDAGDDVRLFDQGQSLQAGSGYSSYGMSPGSMGQPMRNPSLAGQASLPYRQPTQSSLGGYQHQYQAPSSTYAPYNPAQYQPHSQAQYNPQSYGSPQLSQSSSAYQPYIPAAYHDSTLNRNASVHNNYFSASPQTAYGQSSQQIGRSDTYHGSVGQSYHANITVPHSQSYSNYSAMSQASVTTPPPPPPPHLESHATMRPYSHSTGTYQDQYVSGSSPYNDGGSTLSSQPSPDINRNHSSASRVSNLSSSYTTSSHPSIPTPPSRNPSHHSPQRSNTHERHPHGRTLPGLPSESESEQEYGGSPSTTRAGYDDLMNHLDEAIGSSSTAVPARTSTGTNDPLFASASPQFALSPDEKPTHLNGIVSTGDHNINYGAFANDSDAEAAAGLAAMQAADEQEAAEEARRHSNQIRSSESNPRISDQERSDESDFGAYDLSLAGGGYAGTMHYGDEPQISHYAAAAAAVPQNDYYDRLNPRMSSVRSSGVSSEGRASQTSGFESIPANDSMHPFPYPLDVARVDAGGTGGLTEPSPHPRRLSYEDGDETQLLDSDVGASPSRESIPDLFFHPGMSQQRPLPPPPSGSDPGQRSAYLSPAGAYTHQARYSTYEQVPRIYPTAPDAYQQDAQSPSAVPRSTSLVSGRSVNRNDQPSRSKTDTDRARALKQQQGGRPFSDVYDVASPRADIATLDLPSIPRKKFDPAKISTDQFKKCTEPWATSSILVWIKDLAEEETDLKEQSVQEAVTALFTNKVPTMNTIEAESLGEKFVRDMFSAGVLVRDEEWVKFGSGTMSGVLFQLTGVGCYSSKLHLYPMKGRCYAYQCMRTLKKVDLSLPSIKKESVWHEYYSLTKEDLETRDKKEVERQNVLHEIVTSEETYLGYLDVVRVLYRDQLEAQQPPILSAKRMPGFLRDVFGLTDKVKKVNEDFLLAQLKYRQNEQGPWVVGYSDIFREWIRRARSIYVEYAAAYPRADWLVRDEEKRNLLFKQFLDRARQDPRSSRLTWDSHLKSPITRIQRYILLLEGVLKLMKQDSEEKTNLAFAIDEIKAAAHEADVRVAENNKKVELSELSRKIKLRRPMEREVDLALDHLGRAIIIRGDLQRQGGRGINWVDTHAILFDHYLVLAKLVVQHDSSGMQRQEVYDVSKSPIPMDLIILESSNDPAVMRSSMRGIAAVSTTVVPRATQSVGDPRLARTTSGASGGSGSMQATSLTHTNTGFSTGTGTTAASVVTTTVLEPNNSKEDKILYPFRVKHLGKTEVYTLYAPTAEKRQEWCEAITSAKTLHAEALFAQNAEPFKLRVLADTAFGSEGYSYAQKRIVIKGTPLDRAIKEAEKRYGGQGRPAPICRSAVNCATVFHQPHGRLMCAIGTDSGVYISEYQNPRGWIRSIQMNRVTQIAVLEEFNLFILLSEKALIAYHLDVVCPPSGPPVTQTDASARKAPQKLSGSKDVSFFVAGKMKDRALVFYQKKEGINSIFKVLEPVLQKSATSKSRWLGNSGRRGQTEFFREYDEFYIPSETYSLNLFHSSLAVSTKRGVEVLTLDKKNPWGVPNLRSDSPETQAHLSSIANRIKDLKPLGMFRLSEAEFLVTFEECAVYVNKHGDISRGVVMEFVGKSYTACLYGAYLILFNEDFVEIRDAQNGRLKQVIAGKEIRMLDDGGNAMPGSAQSQASLGGGMNGLGVQGFTNTPRTVKIAMQHPEYEKSYVLVELLLATEQQ